MYEVSKKMLIPLKEYIIGRYSLDKDTKNIECFCVFVNKHTNVND